MLFFDRSGLSWQFWLYMAVSSPCDSNCDGVDHYGVSKLDRSLSEWGLNFKNSDLTLEIILKFSVGWIIGTAIFTLIIHWLAGWSPLFNFYLRIENILIYLIFESIIGGISEEIVFRGLVYDTLFPNFSKKIKIGFSISYARIISSVFFAIAHVESKLFPLIITAFAPMQVFIAFAPGLFYAVL